MVKPRPNEIDDFFNTDVAGNSRHYSIDSRSRTISLIKITLLVLAGVLCLILLLFPSFKKDISEFTLDFMVPDGDIEKMTATDTSFYITDAKGQINNFSAESIKETSAGSKIYELIKPEASIPVDDKEWINLRSPDGTYDQQQEIVRLPRKVELFYSRGFNIDTRDFIYNFKVASGYSHQPVVGYGFLGHLNADGLEISSADHTLIFIGKTAIIIDENSLKKE